MPFKKCNLFLFPPLCPPSLQTIASSHSSSLPVPLEVTLVPRPRCAAATASKDALLTLDICVGSLLTLWEQKVAVCGVARSRPFQGDPPPAAAQCEGLDT